MKTIMTVSTPEFEILELRKHLAKKTESLETLSDENLKLKELLNEAVKDSGESLSKLNEEQERVKELDRQVQDLERELALKVASENYEGNAAELYTALGHARDTLARMGKTVHDCLFIAAASMGALDEADERWDFLKEVETVVENLDRLLIQKQTFAS